MSWCLQDAEFGPGSACRILDFTIYFEQTMLSFTPDLIFMLLASIRIAFLACQTRKLANPASLVLFCTKLLATALAVAAAVAHAVYALNDASNIPLWWAAPALQIPATARSIVILGTLIVLEHWKSVTPSSIVIVATFLKGLFTATAVRTYSHIGLWSQARGLYVSAVTVAAFYFLILCVELVEKRHLLKRKSLPTVSTASFVSRSLYFWLLPLLFLGRRKALNLSDCGVIPPKLTAVPTRNQLKRGLAKTRHDDSYLLKASSRAFGYQFLAPVLPRVVLLLATFAQPLLVNQTLKWISDLERPPEHGYALVGGFVCVYFIITFSTSLYWEKVFDAIVGYRGALVGSLYEKSLALSSASCVPLGGGVASTYMSVDVERIVSGANLFHEAWAAVLSIFLAVIVIYQQATWTAFLPIGVSLLILLMATRLSRPTGLAQANWLKSTDLRVKYLASMINNMLPIKWSGYEEGFASHIKMLRKNEMQGAHRFYNLISVIGALTNSAGTLCTLAVLGPYAALASRGAVEPLDPARLFTIVTTVNLLSQPLDMLGQSFPMLAAAHASMKRIQSFLLLEERAAEHPLLSEKNSDLAATAIHIEGASFAWTPSSEPFLRDITLKLDEDKLYICVGSVASGKTLLLTSILGETYQDSGEYITPTHRIAYASQDALIVPGTIRENILFGLPLRKNYYHQVLAACALNADLATFSAGDGTFLGDAKRLSGGQSQRIALARAVYSNAPWTLLDDSFSALDAETSGHITRSLFGPNGLLIKRAVLLVTHDVKHLALSNHIIVLEDGRVKYQGTLSEIQSQGYSIDERVVSNADEEGRSQDVLVERIKEYAAEEEEEEHPIVETSKGWVPYLLWIRMSTWKRAILTFLLIIIAAGTRLAIQVYLRQWSATADAKLIPWVCGYAALSVGLVFATATSTLHFCGVVAQHTGPNMHSAEVDGLLKAPPSYIMATAPGRVINRFSQDILYSDLEVPIACVDFLTASTVLTGMVIFILLPVPYLAIAIVPLGVFYYLCLKFYAGTAKQLQALEAAARSPLYTLFSTTVSGLQTIRALHVQSHFLDANDAFLNKSQRPFFFRFGSIRFLRTLLSLFALVVATALSAFSVSLKGKMDPSTLGLALSSLTGLTSQLTQILMTLADLENGSVAISRIHEVATLTPERETDTVMQPMNSQDWPATGHMLFKDVQLRYKPDLPQVLKGVTFSVSGGQKIGICGRSGSGKSSLILALYRALDQSLMGGQIFIDGTDIATIPLSMLRRSLSLVSQNPFLWHSSIRDNLDPQGEATEVQIWAALQQVGLGVAISELPEKLDTVLEDGGSLSKGQRQLLCLSRVLLRKRKIVVLDEASSSLDIHTDEQIRRVVRTELKESTVIAVAHRISTIIDFDKIIVMGDGAIVETGSPRELMSRGDSNFYRLASSQGIFVA